MFDLERLGAAIKDLVAPENKKEKLSPEEIHTQYVYEGLGQTKLCESLQPDDIAIFIAHHNRVRAKLLASNDRRVIFKIQQLDNLIERGLEKFVREAHGETVIEKWN